MGYGKNLKDILNNKGMTVKELARKTGIAPTTLYSIIQRDTAIRFDTALRISNILDIPINSICKDNPYDDMETLPKLPSDKERLMVGMERKAYFSDRTLKIIKNFDYTELPMVDQLIADFFVLDDATRRDLFKYMAVLKKNHSNPERHDILRKTMLKKADIKIAALGIFPKAASTSIIYYPMPVSLSTDSHNMTVGNKISHSSFYRAT